MVEWGSNVTGLSVHEFWLAIFFLQKRTVSYELISHLGADVFITLRERERTRERDQACLGG